LRYIDLDRVLGDPEVETLIEAADEARAEILATEDFTNIRALIASHRGRWVAFRPAFERIFGPKCWYTECENPGTDDDIDHFRPKGRVVEDPRHDGYWWEALNWRNFRLSCHRANRLRESPDTGLTLGKGNHFPLLVEGERCRAPADDLGREQPTLLDPTVPQDPPVLTFNIDGTVDVAADYAADSIARRKVDDSRIYLHLEWPRFKEDRQRIYREVRTKVSDGDRAFARLLTGDQSAKEPLKLAVRDLIRMAEPRARYSKAAQSYIRVFRDRVWVKLQVLPNIEVAA
jgi:hypothetical protein